jgi:hypothetical protein
MHRVNIGLITKSSKGGLLFYGLCRYMQVTGTGTHMRTFMLPAFPLPDARRHEIAETG